MIDCSGAWIHIGCHECGEMFEYQLDEMGNGSFVFSYDAMIKELLANNWTVDEAEEKAYCETCSEPPETIFLELDCT